MIDLKYIIKISFTGFLSLLFNVLTIKSKMTYVVNILFLWNTVLDQCCLTELSAMMGMFCDQDCRMW